MSSLKCCFLVLMRLFVIIQALVLLPCAAMTDDLYDEEPEFMDKRQSSLSQECIDCLTTNDAIVCTRCLFTKSSVPFHTAKRGDYPMVRSTRSFGCGCCVMSRFTNDYCCHICKAAKRGNY